MLLIEESKQKNSDLRAMNNSLFDEVHETKEASKQMFNELIRKFYNLKFNKSQKKLVKQQNEDPEQPTNLQRKQGKVTFVLEQKQEEIINSVNEIHSMYEFLFMPQLKKDLDKNMRKHKKFIQDIEEK